MIFWCGGERGPVTPPVFKAGDAVLRGPGGGFDFHTLPPNVCAKSLNKLRFFLVP